MVESWGSDVPFFVYGGAAALASGRGQHIDPLPTLTGLGATLICPAATVEAKTATMYGRLTQQNFSDGGVTQRLIQGIMQGQYSPDLFYNAFEDVVLREFAGLKEICGAVYEAVGKRPHLTGAGPALFLFPSSEQEKKQVGPSLAATRGTGVFCTHPGANRKNHQVFSIVVTGC